MSFSATGDCQLLTQIYNYKGHRIACSVKVLPTPVTHFEREATNDYHWMTAARWARIESALFRLLENLAQWKDAQKLRGELLIDHINVRVQATEKPHPATQSLLAGAALAPDDLSLDLTLQYMMHEDTTILEVLTTKRKLATEAEANGTVKSSSSGSRSKAAGSGYKPKAGLPKKSKPKHIDADDEDDDDGPTASGSQPPPKTKRERRSISQGGGVEKQKSSSNGRTSPQAGKRSMSSSRRNSTASSAESKAARRSGRSPIRPSRFKNFVLGQAQQKKGGLGKTEGQRSKEKPLVPSPAKKLKAKPVTASPAKAPKVKSVTPPPARESKVQSVTPPPAEALKMEQMDGARLDALQKLDSILAIPKPREVQILLLENMGEAEVLATFEGYRSDFDRLFQERKHKAHTNSYMHLCHTDVMDILSTGIRNKMMRKLGESYSTQSSHTSLLINGLLPLWIVLLFKDTYKLSHREAVHQIRDQVMYSTYLKAVNDEPLGSDLDG